MHSLAVGLVLHPASTPALAPLCPSVSACRSQSDSLYLSVSLWPVILLTPMHRYRFVEQRAGNKKNRDREKKKNSRAFLCRSEERSEGKEGVTWCRSRGSPDQ